MSDSITLKAETRLVDGVYWSGLSDLGLESSGAVSYTQLTLPTIYTV